MPSSLFASGRWSTERSSWRAVSNPPRPTLEAALVRVAGREQMTVRVYERQARGEAITRSTVALEAAADLGPGARYLLERRRAHGR